MLAEREADRQRFPLCLLAHETALGENKQSSSVCSCCCHFGEKKSFPFHSFTKSRPVQLEIVTRTFDSDCGDEKNGKVLRKESEKTKAKLINQIIVI
jgi:hypothetical protein